jgi:hypothetical protein
MPFVRPHGRSLAARTALLKELSISKHFALCQIGTVSTNTAGMSSFSSIMSKIKNAAIVPFVVVERCVVELCFCCVRCVNEKLILFFFFFFFYTQSHSTRCRRSDDDEASAYADYNYACDAIAPMLDDMSDADAPQFVRVRQPLDFREPFPTIPLIS